MQPEVPTEKHHAKDKQLDNAAWGVFFVWLGVSLLARLPWGVWLLGVGVLILGAQLARRTLGLRHDVFWLIAGALFVLGGISKVAPFGIHFAIIPVLCIVAGIGLLAKAVTRRAPHHV